MFKKETYSARRFTPLKVVFMAIVFVGVAAALSGVVMFLWNAILPETVGVKPLNFWKAAGLLLLAKILFGGLGSGRGHRSNGKKHHWKNKWMAMNPDERQEAKARWKAYCEQRESIKNKQS